MLTLFIGIVVGIAADRMWPTPVSRADDWVREAWNKMTNKNSP